MNVVAIHQTSKPHELAREINKLTDGIARDEKLAGEHLLTLKGTKPPGITWEHYLKDCGVKISARHADRLIEGFQGPTRKPPIKPKPPSDIVSEPVIDIVDKIPEDPLFSAWEQSDETSRRDFIGCHWDEIKPFVKEELKESIEYLELRTEHLREQEKILREQEGELCKQRKEIAASELGALKLENDDLRRKLNAAKPPGHCAWEKTDGGRKAAGFQGKTGDCGARAVSIATGKPYAEAFEALQAAHAKYVKRHPRSALAEQDSRRRTEPIENGCSTAVMHSYMRSIGWQYTEPERLFLRADMLPKGRLVVLINQHFVAVIDGAIHDTYDSGGAGKRPVEGYWSKAAAS